MPLTACRKAHRRLPPALAVLCFAMVSPVLAQDAPELRHSVEIACHPEQGRAMAAMQDGLANLPRELSGQMRLVHLDGIWCLRLGEAVEEAALRPTLAAVRDKYPQAAMVLGQVGRGKVAARVASRASAEAGQPAQGAATPAARPDAPALSEARPLPPVVLASRTETEAPALRLAQAAPESKPAETAPPSETKPAKAADAAVEKTAPAKAVPTAEDAAEEPLSVWARLAMAAALVAPVAAWFWLRRRRRRKAPVILPHMRDNGPVTIFEIPGLAEADEKRLQTNLGELAQVHANLLSVSKGRPVKSIYVTSCYNGEGKTTCAIGLAHGLSINKAKVLLIDGNPRVHALAASYHTENSPGLCECLEMAAPPPDLPRHTKYPNLYVLPFGAKPGGGRPDLLQGDRLEGVLAAYAEQFDYIIMDGHSISGSDTSIIACMFDGVMLAVQCSRTKWEVLRQTSQKLTLMGATVLGVALNKRRYYIPKFLY